MAPLLKVGLPQTGVYQNIPRSLVYGPVRYQGLGLVSMWAQQGMEDIWQMVKYGKARSHLSGFLLRQSMESMKMELGSNGPMMRHSSTTWAHIVTPSWLEHTWHFLAENKIMVEDDIPDFPLHTEGDGLLMPFFAFKDCSPIMLAACGTKSPGWPGKDT